MAVSVPKFIQRITFRWHLGISFLIRMLFIAYGEFQDQHAEVPFTDIDYKVVTDGARHILDDQSPFKRHTYRYTPLLALILTPNVFLHPAFGKILFSLCDICIGIVIRQIILDEHQHTFEANAKSLLKKNKRFNDKANLKFQMTPNYEQRISFVAMFSSFFWLYNPMAMVIATRGNGDAITTLFILVTIYALQKSVRERDSLMYVMIAGIMHGMAIHFRLYPVAFSLAYYLYLGEVAEKVEKTFWNTIFQFNRKQLLLAFTTIATLVGLTAIFYQKYGYEFLYEAYLYHLVRKDIKHNFSMYFYMNLLNTNPMLIEKILTFLPQFLILLAINVYFGIHRKTLGFCIFLQSFIIVAFNPVVTSQYFIWYLALLPICLKNLKSLKPSLALSYCGLWCSVQAVWLYSAYLLEFKGWNTFGFIWIQGLTFFSVNCFIMKILVDHFDVIANF